MSRDWNIKCLDCNSIHDFSDANHAVKLMRTLIKHRHIIASLNALLNEIECDFVDLATQYGRIDADWFDKHKNHSLIPISEYGDVDDGKSTW